MAPKKTRAVRRPQAAAAVGAAPGPDRLVRPEGLGKPARLQGLQDRHHRLRRHHSHCRRIFAPGGGHRRRRDPAARRAAAGQQMAGELDPLPLDPRGLAQRAASLQREVKEPSSRRRRRIGCWPSASARWPQPSTPNGSPAIGRRWRRLRGLSRRAGLPHSAGVAPVAPSCIRYILR
jgi:hypothetical protein